MNNSRAWRRRLAAAVFLTCVCRSALAILPDELPPTTPPSFTATVVAPGTTVNLSWGTSTDNKGVTGYWVWRCQNPCTSLISIATLGSTARSFTDTGRPENTAYLYEVAAVDAAGNQSDPATANVTTWDISAPSPPSNLGAIAAGPSQINLSWTASTDNVGVSGYAVDYCAGSGCGNFTQLGTTGSTSYPAGSLAQATSYSFRVRAYDAYSNYSGVSNTASAVTQDGTAPVGPSSLSAAAVAGSGTQITLSWPAASDNVGVAAYDIEWCQGSGCSGFTALTSTASTSYLVQGLTPATSYSFRVRARDSAPNYGSYTPTASAITNDTLAPSVPLSPAASASSGTQINFSWNPSTDNVGVSGYAVEYCQGAGCSNFTALGTTASTSFPHQSLTPATSYSYHVRAYDAQSNYSAFSATATATTQDTLAPQPPTSLVATASAGPQIGLTWNPAIDNVGVVAYHIERCQGAGCLNFVEIATTAATSYTNNTGLTDATTYRYQVRARDAFPNYSGYSNAAQATTADASPPGMPTGLTATVNSGTQITLNWAVPFDNVGVTGYAVERCQGASCTNFVQVGTPTTNSFPDSSLTNGTTYRYQVRARDLVPNWSPYSSAVQAMTTDTQAPNPPPTSLAAVAASAVAINLTWTPASDNVGVVAYLIERCQGTTCTNYVQVGTSPTANYSDSGLTPGTAYRYQVRARDAVPLYSGYSNAATATTASDNQAPTPPTQLAATPASATGINLTWTASNDNIGVASYVIERCTGTTCTNYAQVGTSTVTSYADSNLTPSTAYHYQVRARDAVPNTSGPSNAVTATTQADTSTPSVPGGVAASAGTSSTQITVTWNPSNDNVGVTGYQVDRCQGVNCTTFSQVATPSASPFNDTNRTPNTTYQYRVRARDAAGNVSGNSVVVSAATLPDTQAPTPAPGNLRTTQITTTQINLAWNASNDNVGVTGYKIERCTGSGCATFAQIGTSATLAFNDPGRTQYTVYRYRVRAYDAAGLNSTYSSILTVTTLDGQAPTTPGPLSLTINLSQIALIWGPSNDNVGVTAYLVERCLTSSCTYTQIASVTTLSYTDTSVASATNYTYRVSARDARGNQSGYATSTPAQSAECD